MHLPVRKLILDVKTRRNSTYLLNVAYNVKDAFSIYMEKDASFVTCLTKEDWEKVKHILEILSPFYEATQIILGSDYPTSNLFLIVVLNVKGVLEQFSCHVEAFVRSMVSKMQEKFDKYWEECNLVMSIGSILDPRRKIISLEFAFESLYSTAIVSKNIDVVRESLHTVFNEYKMLHDVELSVQRSSSSSVHNVSSASHITSFSEAPNGQMRNSSTWSKFESYVKEK
ncbi:hypothetical protein LIER_41083 [Lithospermum erythrorhizon]|uniref:hAT-like transposase RNase-H fold domain-containing protein n=1 Tax=Lithospermum erythrorhizon TaxID=34254 RepID=A0AAV3R5B6_LITER